MTQPRKEQIKSVNTRFSPMALAVTPNTTEVTLDPEDVLRATVKERGAGQTTFDPGFSTVDVDPGLAVQPLVGDRFMFTEGLNAGLISQVSQVVSPTEFRLFPPLSVTEGTSQPFLLSSRAVGVQEDVQATVRGTVVGPFPILNLDGIVFSIDGAPDQTVTFTATDTTCSRVADRINSTLGVDVASNDRGFLVLQSPTAGDSSSLEISNSAPGTLGKLGLVAGTYTGISGPSAGVLTRTADLLGGTAPVSTTDGRTLVTDTQAMAMKELSGTVTQSYWEVPGGVPVVGKVIWDGSSFILRYMAEMPPKASVVTFSSTFSLLDGGDSLDLTVDGIGSFAVTFPAFPYDRDGVVDRINAIYATNAGFADGRSRVLTTVSSPFDFAAGEQFHMAVDGGAPQTVTFAGTEVAVADVIATITGAVAGTAITQIVTGGGNLMRIESTNTAGATSSLEFWSDAAWPGTLAKLGIRAGLYRGVFIAEPWGPEELRLRSFLRGAGAAVTVGGPPSTLDRMGLSAGTVNGSDVPAFEPVRVPHDTVDQSSVTPYDVKLLLPDVREFGETRPEEETRNQEFQARSSGSDVDYLNAAHLQDTAAAEFGSNTAPGRGMFSAGKPASVAPDGTVPAAVRAVTEAAGRLFKQIMNTTGGVVTRLVAREIVTPGDSGNPVAASATMDVRVDPGDIFPASLRSLNFWAGSVQTAAVAYDPGALAAVQRRVELRNSAALYSVTGALPLSDANIRASGGLGALPLSSGVDRTVRLGEFEISGEAIESDYNVMRSLNARHTVVCGDGVDTFGDFNGDYAVNDAITFANSVGITDIHIVLKPGTYLQDSIMGRWDFSGFNSVVIEGSSEDVGNTESTDGRLAQIDNEIDNGLVGPTSGTLVLRRLSIHDTTPNNTRRMSMDRGVVIFEDCEFLNYFVELRMPTLFRAIRCEFYGNGVTTFGRPLVEFIQDANTSPGTWTNRGILFEDCYMSGTIESAVIEVSMSTTSASQIRYVRFENCSIIPGRSEVSSFGGVLLQSVGAFNIQPGPGTAMAIGGTGGGSTGLTVHELSFRRCRFRPGFTGTGTARSYLSISPNGYNGSGSSWDISTDPSVRYSRVILEDITAYQTSSHLSETPFFYVGGIGLTENFEWGQQEPMPGIYVKNFKFDCTAATTVNAGAATTNSIPFLTNPFAPWSLTGDIWPAAIQLAGEVVRVEDLQITGAKAGNDWPDILLFPYRHMKVDGLYMDSWSTDTPGSAPDGRVAIRQITFPSTFGGGARKDRTTWVIEGLVIDGGNQTADWVSVTGTIVMIEPTGPRIQTAGNLHTYPGDSFHLRNFAIRGFITPTPFNLPVMVGSYGQSDGYGPNNTQDTGGRYGHDGLLLENGNIGQPDFNTAAAQGRAGSYGVWFHAATPEIGVAVKCRNLAVTGCYFYGIRIDQKDFETLTTIEDCYITECGLDLDNLGAFGTGIVVTGYNWRGYTVIRDNLVTNNNDTPSDIQITCRIPFNMNLPPPEGTRATKCSIYGNSCFHQTKAPSAIVASIGEINATQNDITLLSAISPSLYLGVYVRGLETAFASSGGTASNINQARYDVGFALIHNLAFLRSSFSDV